MSLLSLEVAKAHLRIIGDDANSDLELKLQAAEQAAATYLNRRLYASQAELDAAIAAVPGRTAAARSAHTAAIVAAAELVNADDRALATDAADGRLSSASIDSILVYRGMVITSEITAAILLTLGDLYENREDAVVGVSVAPLPRGAKDLLRPHRVGVGL
ncbi:hypothetical protein ASF61_16805 [Duganella sp. Leaf126]|uniref:head-tail connector protein n=1 Tax=Duganella sp. Leaf126 TaxID=1736266 RepID=UPI0006F96AE9|nr:head-tail connector protein [Duganella sp. Leaf126]KQQ31994.1 hypothetical protein ASF61_16805 [Duganella sp. Leaf126]